MAVEHGVAAARCLRLREAHVVVGLADGAAGCGQRDFAVARRVVRELHVSHEQPRASRQADAAQRRRGVVGNRLRGAD